jgi:hypothetical protein
MNVKELIERLRTMPQDAEVYFGVEETGHDKEGYMLFHIDEDDVNYRAHVWSFGNASPRPPSGETNVVVFTR